VLARQGKLDQARQAIRDIPESEAGDAKTKLLAEAQILRDAQQYRAAYDLLAQRNTGPHTDADVTYEQAMLAEKLGDLADMERLLRSIMSSQPDYHAAYNALGYSLAERNLRLSEARQLIQKALTFAPNDPFISDSLGWVEYRLGNLSTAANILEAAFKVRPDAEIGSHLGEVLWHMGQQDKALDYWKAAQQLSPDNQTLSATLKRLQIKW
jgi:tetratricopeptide (TPR) repeat protein